ncbi:MAG: 6-phosphofructokinase [Candidatus Limnocylindrales bacterium]
MEVGAQKLSEKIRVAILTSGGDAPGMNAAIRAVVKGARTSAADVIAIRNGGLGLVRDALVPPDYVPLTDESVTAIIDRSGTILKTSREDEILAYLKAENDAVDPTGSSGDLLFNVKTMLAERAIRAMRAHVIDGLLLIGGDNTAAAAMVLAEASDWRLPIVVIPATIDNDVPGTYESVGFDSAVAFAVQMVDAIRASAMSHGRLFIVEVMGRNQGNIALEVALACGVDEVLIPEERYSASDLDRMAQRLLAARARGHESALIVVAEGVDSQRWVIHRSAGHPSPGLDLEAALKDRLGGWEVRTSILGHTQRGAPPTPATRNLAARLGLKAIDEIVRDIRSSAVGPAKLVGVDRAGRVIVGLVNAASTPSTERKNADVVRLVRRLAY